MSNTLIVITFWRCTLTATQIHDINNLINMNIEMLADKRYQCVCFFVVVVFLNQVLII